MCVAATAAADADGGHTTQHSGTRTHSALVMRSRPNRNRTVLVRCWFVLAPIRACVYTRNDAPHVIRSSSLSSSSIVLRTSCVRKCPREFRNAATTRHNATRDVMMIVQCSTVAHVENRSPPHDDRRRSNAYGIRVVRRSRPHRHVRNKSH